MRAPAIHAGRAGVAAFAALRPNAVIAVALAAACALNPAPTTAPGAAEAKPPAGESVVGNEKPTGSSTAAAPGHVPPQVLSADEARDDLRALYASMRSAHYDLFAHRSEREYDDEYDRLLASIKGPLGRLELYRLFMRFAAHGRVSHARVEFPWAEYGPYVAAEGTILPFDLRLKDGRAYIIRDFSGDERLEPGMELVAMDGRPFAEWIERLGRYVAAERPYMVESQLELMFTRLLWLERGPVAKFEVGARRRGDGRQKVVTVTIAGVSAKRIDEARDKGEAAKPLREVKILPDGVAYLRPGPFYDPGGDPLAGQYDANAFATFVDAAFRKVIADGARDLIIDIRNNPGGDNSFSDLMIAWFATRPSRFCSSFLIRVSPEARRAYQELASQPLAKDNAEVVARFNATLAAHKDGERVPFPIPDIAPRPEGERFKGRVYVLINRHTYSNATAVAAQIQDHGFGKVLGEETSEIPSGYGALVQFTLPRSGIVVSYPKSYFVRPSGDETLRGVVPDFPIEFPVVTGGNDTDTVLQAAVKIVKKQR
jgi:hypothetical protein